MKNLLAANIVKDNKRSREMKKVLQAQIHNSLDVGWEEKDIIVICNFDFEYMGVKSIKVDLNKTCLTGTKLFATKYVFDNNMHEGQMVDAHEHGKGFLSNSRLSISLFESLPAVIRGELAPSGGCHLLLPPALYSFHTQSVLTTDEYICYSQLNFLITRFHTYVHTCLFCCGSHL